jgi:hypothetical protein
MAATFREAAQDYRAKFADEPNDENRHWFQWYAARYVAYATDWHYFTQGEVRDLDCVMQAAGAGIYNGCTSVWLSEVYGPTVERDDVIGKWRMPHAEWVRHEANRLELTA